MRDVNRDERRDGGRRVRYPGIVKHAAMLGVSRQHLWLVLHGRRQSLRLMDRYNQLIERERYEDTNAVIS